MASTLIRVNGRPFNIMLRALKNDEGFKCYFHEKYEVLGITLGYKPSNKNSTYKASDDVYNWFKQMVKKNTPSEKDEGEVLDEIVNKLNEEFDEVKL